MLKCAHFGTFESKSMKIATWNVNSFNVRHEQVMDWLHTHSPDVLVLQELKMEQDKFPAAALNMMGWQTAWSGQKTYNGVAIISRHAIENVQMGLPQMPDDPQRRVIAATINGVRVIDVYCVNGEALDSEKFVYKRQWFAALTHFVREQMAQYPELVLLGDFNIAPADDDVYDPVKWHEKIHCSSEERSWFKALLDLGLCDSLRQIHPTGAHYTWFDYRGGMFPKGLGLRIDHILVSAALKARLRDVQVDLKTRANERPSDHAPVFALFD
ncbi:exodeoxyribonuclease-3 [Alysiella filiformis DSM 16848]|uniref:Exodeoxyribonuclease-3 n=2 Tax=Alysiella TaxID=194195 RepID=A0A286E2B1_9NEIS|nr:exodeoxyribonuclease-3 [Alysiella filiformis DSM 16848]